MEEKRLHRNESTERGRKIWAAVDAAADKAPSRVKERLGASPSAPAAEPLGRAREALEYAAKEPGGGVMIYQPEAQAILAALSAPVGQPGETRIEGWALQDGDEWLFSPVQLHDIDEPATLIIRSAAPVGATAPEGALSDYARGWRDAMAQKNTPERGGSNVG